MSVTFLVDGNWYLHRCYYTIKPRYRTIDQALQYAFVAMVCKDALSLRADHLLVAFDGAQVFRYALYPQYKANRSENENTSTVREGFKNIYEYLPAVLSLLNEIKIPFIQPLKFEADDVLCSGARAFSQGNNDRVYCGTKDKDAYQYLSDRVSLYDSSHRERGELKPQIFTAGDAVKAKGVKISQMCAYQTLVGDKIDNIPSFVKPKRAVALLQKHNTIRNLLKDKACADLLPHVEALKLNAKLVTLSNDCPLPQRNELTVPRIFLDEEMRKFLPRHYFDYVEFLNPKAKGLFH